TRALDHPALRVTRRDKGQLLSRLGIIEWSDSVKEFFQHIRGAGASRCRHSLRRLDEKHPAEGTLPLNHRTLLPIARYSCCQSREGWDDLIRVSFRFTSIEVT